MEEYVKQLRWERDIALQQLKEIGCELGRDMSDIKTAIEKQIPKVPKEKSCTEKTHYYCPNCGFIPLTIYADGYHLGNKPNYCERCGQAIDWTEVD